jgi:hypothetical protein
MPHTLRVSVTLEGMSTGSLAKQIVKGMPAVFLTNGRLKREYADAFCQMVAKYAPVKGKHQCIKSSLKYT